MKFYAVILMLLANLTDPAKIGKINSVKEEARKAYLAGDFKTAAEKYKYLLDSLDVNEDEVRLNLANAYFNADDSVNATGHYQALTQSRQSHIRSRAQQQLGVLANKQGKFEEALNHFKEAVKSDPSNNDARYNYELLKKKLEEKKKQEQQQRNEHQQNKDQQQKDQNKEQQNKDQKDQQKKDQQNQDQQKKDEQNKQNEQNKDQQQQKEDEQNQEKKDVPPSVSEKLEQMNMTEEKARMILEAMKNQEMQYLQQNKRKPTKPKDKGKPDW